MLDKIESKLDIKKLIKNLLIAFIIAQPILDIYMSFFDSKIQILGVSLATIIRFLWVFIITILTIVIARKRKNTKFFILYAIIVLVYSVFHHFNAIGFTVKLAQGKYSSIGEIFYIARMCIPVALIYVIYNIKLNYKDIKKIIVSVSLIISFCVILTNLFKVSFIAYSENQDYISGNIIEWFTKGRDSEDEFAWVTYSSRGWFQSGNQLSELMVIFIPIITYIALKENKIRYWFILTMDIVTMICLTTRVGALGGILAMLITIFIYILQKIIHKQVSLKIFTTKGLYCAICTILVLGVFLNSSPFKIRAELGDLGYDIMGSTNIKDNTDKTDIELDDLAKIKYIEEKAEKEKISEFFIYQAYPYTDDIEFWYDLLANVPSYERAGARKMKTLLLSRILERDNRFSDYILGLSFTRTSTFVWPERDFESQMYALGGIGFILFVGPYILIFILGIYEFFRHFKENLYLNKVLYMISMFMGFVAAYSSGHVINEIFPFTFLSLSAGIVLNMFFGNNPDIYEKENNLRKYFEKLYPDGKDKFYSQIQDDLLNENKKFIVTANPETLMIAEKNEEFKNCLLQEYVTIIPDGVGIIKGAKLLDYPQKETITGVDLVKHLLKVCNEKEKRVFFFGAKPEVVNKLCEVIKKTYPKLKIVGSENGYIENKQEIFDKIKQLKPDLVLVALGIPQQELLINENFKYFNKGIFIGVGGSFDVLSGMKKRAPKIFIKLRLEWLYRITTEPKRIKRFIDSNIKYLFKIARER